MMWHPEYLKSSVLKVFPLNQVFCFVLSKGVLFSSTSRHFFDLSLRIVISFFHSFKICLSHLLRTQPEKKKFTQEFSSFWTVYGSPFFHAQMIPPSDDDSNHWHDLYFFSIFPSFFSFLFSSFHFYHFFFFYIRETQSFLFPSFLLFLMNRAYSLYSSQFCRTFFFFIHF